MELLDSYVKAQQQLFDYFGYIEDWRVIPIEDSRHLYWSLSGEGRGDEVIFADSENGLHTGDCCTNEIYAQRHLPKWVYRGVDYTMVCCDTHTDGNKLLRIFCNANERVISKDTNDYY